MTQNEILEFLKSGALIRLPSGKLRLWKGPFRPVTIIKEPVFSVAYMDYDASQPQFLQSSTAVVETEVSTFRGLLQPHLSQVSFSGHSFFQPSFEKFQDSYQIIQGKIHRGELEKAVPVVFAESPLVPSLAEKARMLWHALESHPELYVYGFWNESTGVIGASPEILFHVKENHLRTMALAGTRPQHLESELLKDPKELKEHQFVIDDLKQKLEKYGWPKVGSTKTASFGPIAHLKTEIEIELSHVEIEDLLKQLHPTAALGVFPRNYGIHWMKELAYQAQRGVFGAPLTFSISHTEVISIVAIRCLQWSENGSQIGTGCGIIASSDLQKEWRELALKRQSVMKILGLDL